MIMIYDVIVNDVSPFKMDPLKDDTANKEKKL